MSAGDMGGAAAPPAGDGTQTFAFETAQDALAYRTFRGGRARQLRRKTMPALRELAAGYGIAIFGRASKDDLEGSILEYEFPLAKENLAIHVLYHAGLTWDGCQHCHRPWCGASGNPAVTPTSADPICCGKDLRSAASRPCAS